jgi:hypothetical protein
MADSILSAFQADLEAAKRDLDQFSKFYKPIRYNYYYSKPTSQVPDQVWHYIADEYEVLPDDELDAYDQLDVSPDKTACLTWTAGYLDDDDEQVVAVKQFGLLCRLCCLQLRDHVEVLAVVPEIQALVKMPPGHHQWMRLIHLLAQENPVWANRVRRRLVVSQRPNAETRSERGGEQPKWEQRLLQELKEQGIVTPDIWVEHIPDPGPVVAFHSQMLDVLHEVVRASLVEALSTGDKLTRLQKNLIKALGMQKLSTKALSGELTALTGKHYGISGQVKTALSELVKRGLMTSDRQDGYELTDLGFRVLQNLKKLSQDCGPA